MILPIYLSIDLHVYPHDLLMPPSCLDGMGAALPRFRAADRRGPGGLFERHEDRGLRNELSVRMGGPPVISGRISGPDFGSLVGAVNI